MNWLVTTILLVAGGAGLVIQNVFMLQARALSGSIWAALWLNSLIGLAVLTAIVLSSDGIRPFARLASAPAWWFVVPGILGTLYVLASLRGYVQFGASVTVGALVASQLTAGLLFDVWRSGSLTWSAGLGVVFLIIGATLVARSAG